jgi:oligoribonuclease
MPQRLKSWRQSGDELQHRDNLIWIDLEMTGLRTDVDSIIEIATVVTDAQLQVLAEGPVYAIATPESVLAGMDEWNTRQHGASGLVERIRTQGVSMAQAEAGTLEFLRQWVQGGLSPMCGNSICQDRRFLARQMPQLERYFHYRNLDVSTVKELARRWLPQLSAQFTKQAAHLALADIHDSIRELRFYREGLFVEAARAVPLSDVVHGSVR